MKSTFMGREWHRRDVLQPKYGFIGYEQSILIFFFLLSYTVKDMLNPPRKISIQVPETSIKPRSRFSQLEDAVICEGVAKGLSWGEISAQLPHRKVTRPQHVLARQLIMKTTKSH
jgi:hypothetical protein